jgi:hypothetical protein
MVENELLRWLRKESDELIAIFVSMAKKVKAKML